MTEISYIEQLKLNQKSKNEMHKNIWRYELKDYSISEFEKLVLKLLYVTRNIHEVDLINILRPILQTQSIKAVLKDLEKAKYIHSNEINLGRFYALNSKGVKLFNINPNRTVHQKVELSKKNVYLYKCLYSELAMRVITLYGNRYFKKYNIQSDKTKLLYIIKEYIRNKVYYQFVANKYSDERYNILVMLGVPQNEAMKFSQKRYGRYVKEQLVELVLEKTDLKDVQLELKESNYFDSFVKSISIDNTLRFDLLYNLLNPNTKTKRTDVSKEIYSLISVLEKSTNNFLKFSNHLPRIKIKNQLIDEVNTEWVKNINLEGRIQNKSKYYNSLLTTAKNLRKGNKEDVNKKIEAIESEIQVTEKSLNEDKLNYRIPLRKKVEDEICFISPTFNYLRSKGIYIGKIKDLDVEITIVDNVQDGMQPHLLFERIDIALETFRMIDSRFKLNYKVVCHNEIRCNNIKKGIDTLNYHFEKYPDEGFCGIMDRIEITSARKIQTDRKQIFLDLCKEGGLKNEERDTVKA